MAKEQGENSLIIDKQTFYNDDSGYVIQGRVDNKNISSLTSNLDSPTLRNSTRKKE